jgi:hypothetical protein
MTVSELGRAIIKVERMLDSHGLPMLHIKTLQAITNVVETEVQDSTTRMCTEINRL